MYYVVCWWHHLTALRWTISILLMSDLRWGSHTEQTYSRDGLTNDLYVCSLTEVEPMFRLRRRKPRVLLPLPQMLLMSSLIVTPTHWLLLPLADCYSHSLIVTPTRWLLLPLADCYSQIFHLINRFQHMTMKAILEFYRCFITWRWLARYIYLGGKPSSIIVPTVLVYQDLFAG